MTTNATTRLVCIGCGAEARDDDPLPFRCANAGSGDTDHVLRRELVASAEAADSWTRVFLDEEPNPFVRYRALLHSHTVAMKRGMPDEAFVALVRRLDAAVASAGGVGFHETPFRADDGLNTALGRRGGTLSIKDETGDVSGSHKARHMFGLLLWLEVMRQTGLLGDAPTELAIASCGNAALGAAVVAHAARLPLHVFVPTDAHPAVVARLRELGAFVEACPRDEAIPGDPCIHRFHEKLAGGALPFGAQGNENGLALEGGLTLGFEIVSALLRERRAIDRIFIQVGGGALASSCIQALQDAVTLGLIERIPVIHPVQTTGAYPLYRAWDRAARYAVDGDPGERKLPPRQGDPASDVRRAAEIAASPRRHDTIRFAATHRSKFMWPWEAVPHSIAHGILDDETYDWLAVLDGTFASGGFPIVVSEEDLGEANRLAQEAGVNADATGSSGLAGCLRLVREGVVGAEESVVVLLTGVRR